MRKFDFQNQGYLPFEEFDEALNQIMPSVHRKDKRLRYKHAESLCKPDMVPLERLAQISAYLMFHAIYSARWVSSVILSKEFLDAYYKDGIKDEMDETDSDDNMSNNEEEMNEEHLNEINTILVGQTSSSNQPTEEEIAQEEAKLLNQLK